MIQLEREEKEQEYMQAKHMLHLFELARQQLELDGQAAECAQYEQQLAVLRQKEQDFSAGLAIRCGCIMKRQRRRKKNRRIRHVKIWKACKLAPRQRMKRQM